MKKSAGKCAEGTHSSSEGPSVSQKEMFQIKHKNPYSKETTKPVLMQNNAGDSNLISAKAGSEVTNLMWLFPSCLPYSGWSCTVFPALWKNSFRFCCLYLGTKTKFPLVKGKGMISLQS